MSEDTVAPKVTEPQRKTGRDDAPAPTRLERLTDAVRFAARGGTINSDDLQDLLAFLEEQIAKTAAPKNKKSE